MPKISQQKKDKIAEQILHHLFSISPALNFTAEISKEIARDEEFTKTILQELKEKKLVIEVNKNKEGFVYTQRKRWRLSDHAYSIFAKKQTQPISSQLEE
jgi:predicted transcriptional regulator with HTH domain